MSSLKCWLRKIEKQDKISKEDLEEIFNRLDGHDKAIRADERAKTIGNVMFAFKNYQNMNNPQNAHIFWEMLEQLKGGKDTNVTTCTDCILDGTDACSRGAGRAVDDEICENFMKGDTE